MLTVQPQKMYEITLGRGAKNHSGYGDCDDIAAASGALLRSIGMQTRIVTTVKPGSPYIFDHVFIQTKPPGNHFKWVTFDPVVHPKAGLGDIAPHARIAYWDLNGNLIAKSGTFPPRFDAVMAATGSVRPDASPQTFTGADYETKMETQKTPVFYDFIDYSPQMGFFGATEPVAESALKSDNVLADFSRSGIVGYGCYAGLMGSTPGNLTPRIMAEYDETDTIGNTGLVRTKAFEMAPDDYQFVKVNGVPMQGALALSDDGEFYQWQADPDGMGGFFKKLFRKARKKIGGAIKRVARRAKKIAKKFVRRLPGGKLLWKIGGKLHNIAMKITKPLLKMVGPLAKKIAPIAALIPGIGPAVSAGLMVTGKVYDIAKKYGVKFDSQRRPMIANKAQGKAFATALAKAGQKMGKSGARRALEKLKKAKKESSGASALINPMFLGFGGPPLERMPQTGIGWL